MVCLRLLDVQDSPRTEVRGLSRILASKIDDEIGNMAKAILNSSSIEFKELKAEFKDNKGEIETVNLAQDIGANFILMDDIKARKKLESTSVIPMRFSPFILFVLYEKGLLSYQDSITILEKMRTKRKWIDNLIIEYAKILFENEKKSD